MRHLLYLCIIAALLLAACGPDHDDMLRQLNQLAEANRADSLLTDDTLALSLTDYFDRHGSANERMMAHYLLGRTYADRGEAPKAVQSYMDAADCADTTSADCDFFQLGIIYGQMANILFYQSLYRNELACLDKAIYYSNLADDTLGVLLAYSQKQFAYEMLGLPDSMLIICEDVSARFRDAGYNNESAGVLATPVDYLLSIGDTIKARKYLETYERESGFFDSNNEIEPGRELYYFVKGNYLMAVHQYDSAEYYYRKELRLNHDFNNQNSAAQGLSLLYQRTNHPDSAAKYALYAYDMNDSLHAQKATEEISRMSALYNYSSYQRQACEEQERAHRNWQRLIIAVIGIAALLVVIIIISLKYRFTRRRYFALMSRYSQIENELLTLREHQARFTSLIDSTASSVIPHQEEKLQRLRQSEQMLNQLIEEKEKELNSLTDELSRYRLQSEQAAKASAVEQGALGRLDFYQHLVRKTNNGRQLDDDEWDSVEKLIRRHLPDFHKFISSRRSLLTEYEYRTSLLIRLYLKPKNIANALDLDGSYVTRVRKSICKKLFGINGTSKELDARIRNVGSFHGDICDLDT